MKKAYIKPSVELITIATTALNITSYEEQMSDELIENTGSVLSKDHQGFDVWDDPYY